jgi:hypothetical protein
MRISHIALLILSALNLYAVYFDPASPLPKEIQKNRDLILSENLTLEDELHPIVKEFKERILSATKPVDFHPSRRITAETEFIEWYLVRPLFRHYEQNPTKSNLTEFIDVCDAWHCRTNIGILIKLATYNRLKEKIEEAPLEVMGLDWALRDLKAAAETEYSYYLEALESLEILGALASDELSEAEINIMKKSESFENRQHFKRMIDFARDRDIAGMIQVDREAAQIKTADDNANMVFKAMWPYWPALLDQIQPGGSINSVRSAHSVDTP